MIAKAILLSFVTIAYGYNVDTQFPIIYSSENTLKDRGSYFGYTVHLYHEPVNDVPWLIIGAPRGNYSSSTKQESRQPSEPGVVFRCMINGKTCHEIKPQEIGNERGYIAQLKMEILIKQQYGWFGSAMSIDESNGMLTVCAPRTVISIFVVFGPSLSTMHGVCYSGMISSNRLSMEQEDLRSYDFSTEFWYDPMHGFSVHYASVKQNEGNPVKESSRIVGEPKHEIYGSVNIEQSSKKISVELPLGDELSQFGFSVESGYFFDRNQLLYVSGAPGWEYVGQVAIMNPTMNALIVGKLDGTSIGEYFGASLAVGDLDNDGLDDLLVGAPYWGQENGKVYIYFGTEKGQFGASVLLQGDIEGGHFGYAIASGDLDADGFDDIIVGAPWEESGVIYIYNGGSDIKDEKLQASQRIEATKAFLLNTSPKIERFGFSISKPVDIDGNGYLDLAVGAYKSGHAIVLRSKPVVESQLLIRVVPNILERDAKQFLIEICLRYDGYNIHSEQVAEQNITIIVDEQYQRTKETFLELRSSNLTSSTCLETRVNVSRNIRDFIEPISILAKYEFAYNISSSRFCKLCPIERKFNKLNIAKVLLPFNIGCGIDKVCNSNISATARFHGVRDNDTWVVGSTDINLEINLSNHGEPAYLTTLEFVFPEGILLRSILPSCQEDTSKKNLIVACDVGNPLWKEERNVKLNLDMKHFINGSLHNQKLNFYITIKSRSTNQGTVNITKTLTLVSEVSLSLNGKANEETYYLSTMNNNNSIISFQHTYQVYKLGATPIEDAQLIIKVPIAIKDSEPLVNLHKPQLYVSGGVFECSSEDVLLDTEVIEVEEPASDKSEMQVLSNETQPNGDHEMRERDINESSIKFYNMKDIKVSQITNSSLMNDVRYMNCSNSEVNCTTIVCDLSALKTLQDIGKLSIKFLLNVQRLKDTFGNNRTVLKFGTEASVEIMKPTLRLPINGTRSTMEIVTMFYKAPDMEELQLWIILVSISVGLLLLFIIIAILNTWGFFKRKGKPDFMNDENDVKDENDEKTEGTTAAIQPEND